MDGVILGATKVHWSSLKTAKVHKHHTAEVGDTATTRHPPVIHHVRPADLDGDGVFEDAFGDVQGCIDQLRPPR